MSRAIDLSGRVFARLTVLSRAGSTKHGQATWLCRCVCGKDYTARGHELTSGHTKSCGCMAFSALRDRNWAHRRRHTAEYRIWLGMIRRCADPGRPEYERYGGRGISVDESWLTDFETFLRDVGERPSPKHSLDRIDNDKSYVPGNVRWATAQEQAVNRRKARLKNIDDLDRWSRESLVAEVRRLRAALRARVDNCDHGEWGETSLTCKACGPDLALLGVNP